MLKLGFKPITCYSQKQLTIVLSSTKAKYRALVSQKRQTIAWLQTFLNKLEQSKVLQFFMFDCMKTIEIPNIHARTKHIEIHYHFIRK
jgi:hypothetical protein